MKNYSLFLKLTLIVGIIGLLNIINFDFSSAKESVATQSNTLVEVNTNVYPKGNLNFGDTFNPETIPYFQTETIPTSTDATTITVQNRWNTSLTIDVQNLSASTIATYIISGSTSSTEFPLTPTQSAYLTIRPGSADGFRNWQNVSNPFVTASGQSASRASSFVHIPDMRYFTTNSTGTEASNYFFKDFFKYTTMTSLPVDSFNISTITEVGDDFFYEFSRSGSLTSLPEGSFDTSNIKYAGSHFFESFNFAGRLTYLPVFSFNFRSLESHGDYAFVSFNQDGSLTSLPYNSFELTSVKIPTGSSVDIYSWVNFNYNGNILLFGRFTDDIRNTSQTKQLFYYALPTPNSGSIELGSGIIYSCYAMDAPTTFTLFLYDDSSDFLGEIYTTQSNAQGVKFTKPSEPTKEGYRFVQWVEPDGTPYDWNSNHTKGGELIAQFEAEPTPTPTTSPTESPTSSPSPTESPTTNPTSSTSPSPSNSGALPSTGDNSWFVFYGVGTSMLLAIISLTIYYLKRKSKTFKK